MSDWEPREDQKSLLTLGMWRVGNSLGGQCVEGSWRIEHKCSGNQMWWPWTYNPENRGYPCTVCGPPPDGIQVAFWFLAEK